MVEGQQYGFGLGCRCYAAARAEHVVEKAAWKGGILQAALFERFEILRHSNQESYRKEKEKAGSGREMGIWLPMA